MTNGFIIISRLVSPYSDPKHLAVELMDLKNRLDKGKELNKRQLLLLVRYELALEAIITTPCTCYAGIEYHRPWCLRGNLNRIASVPDDVEKVLELKGVSEELKDRIVFNMDLWRDDARP